MIIPPRSTAIRQSHDRFRSLPLILNGCLCRRSLPSSRTMICSAFLMVDTRCVTIIRVLPSVHAVLERPAQSGIGLEIERREAVVKDIDRGAVLTRARAMDRRCFCPPETLAPPWEISAASPPLWLLINSAAWADFNRFSQDFTAGIFIGVAQVALNRAGEEHALLRHVADFGAQVVLASPARISAPSMQDRFRR